MEFKKTKKILAIIKIEMQRQMAYRADLLFYRLANAFEIIALITIWSAIYQNNELISGYSYKEMISYVVIGWLMIFLTANYGFEHRISRYIYEGTLSSFLVKPIDFIKYSLVASLGRTSIAFSSGIVMSVIIIIVMFNKIILINNIFSFLIIVLMLILGYFINLFISIILGMLSFWTTFIDGPRYSIRVLINFLAGRFFPLTMLPLFFYKFTLFFPFVYIYFIPLELYLGKISPLNGLKALGIEIIWLFLLYFTVRAMWKKGLKKYEGVGI